jgi:pyruvate ferredoxin oxidoreductase gamma subunit
VVGDPAGVKEMLLVGRGGQGVVLASQILADTFARAGFWVQSFPEFKAERRGAPISAFLRWDESAPIRRRYKVRECDVLVVISASPPSLQATDSVRRGGLVLLNRESRFPRTGPYDIARVPASQIARRNGVLSSEGRPMGNVAMLGGCIRLLLPDALPLLEEAIVARMGGKAKANLVAAREGYARCTRQRSMAGDTIIEHAGATAAAAVGRVRFPVSTTDSLHLHTGSWSEERPVLTEACNSCGLCVVFCPEGVMTRTNGVMAVDELYCKGCGICAQVCPVRGAIHMQEVRA